MIPRTDVSVNANGNRVTGTTGTSTTATGFTVAASPTTVYYWTAQYTGDQFNTGFTTACGAEKTTVVFQP